MSKPLKFFMLLAAVLAISISPLLESPRANLAIRGSGKTDFNNNLIFIQNNTLFSQAKPPSKKSEPAQKLKVVVTAYSSTPWETDSDPLITASGKRVKEGVVANNLLPFGTKIKIPEIFGERVFVVEDRMNPKKGYYHIDVWFPSYSEAKKFGAKTAHIEILQN